MFRAVGLFTLLAAIAVLILGALLSLIFRAPGDRTALVVSGVLAVVVQVLAFTVLRFSPPRAQARWTGWTVGMVLRLVSLVAYALLALRPLGLPATAALVSLAAFYFVTTLLEPRLLRV